MPFQEILYDILDFLVRQCFKFHLAPVDLLLSSRKNFLSLDLHFSNHRMSSMDCEAGRKKKKKKGHLKGHLRSIVLVMCFILMGQSEWLLSN